MKLFLLVKEEREKPGCYFGSLGLNSECEATLTYSCRMSLLWFHGHLFSPLLSRKEEEMGTNFGVRSEWETWKLWASSKNVIYIHFTLIAPWIRQTLNCNIVYACNSLWYWHDKIEASWQSKALLKLVNQGCSWFLCQGHAVLLTKTHQTTKNALFQFNLDTSCKQTLWCWFDWSDCLCNKHIH